MLAALAGAVTRVQFLAPRIRERDNDKRPLRHQVAHQHNTVDSAPPHLIGVSPLTDTLHD